MTRPLVCAFRAMLRPHLGAMNVISRRYTVKDVVAVSKSDFVFQDRTSDSDNHPQIKRGQLVSTFLIERIKKWLQCSTEEAENVLLGAPNLVRCHLDSVSDYVRFLKDSGVDMKLVIQNPWLMDYSLSTMRERIVLLSKVGIKQETVHLLKLRTYRLAKVVEQWISDESSGKYDQNGNRLEFFSNQLQCTVEQLAILLTENCHLLTNDFDDVLIVYNLLVNYGISQRDILSHLDLFNIQSETLKYKLEAIRSANTELTIRQLKIPGKNFFAVLKKPRRVKKLKTTCSEYKDRIGVLTERLECTSDSATTLVKCFPRLLLVSPTRLNTNLDLLYEFGFTPKQIRSVSYVSVLTQTVEKTRARLEELRKVRFKPVSLRPLIQSKENFLLLIRNLQKKNIVCDDE